MMKTPILTFNAKSVSCQKLEKTLVGRKAVVDEIYSELLDKCLNGETYQSLLVAPRGSGKTHLTKVLFCRLEQEKSLRDKILVAYMIEDEYGIVNFTHLCIQILRALHRYKRLPDEPILERIQKISEVSPARQEFEISTYMRTLIGTKKLIVLIENLDTIFKGMGNGVARLRDFMHEHNNISLVATAQNLSRLFKSSDQPFYHFFKTRYLQRLNFEQAFALVQALVDVEDDDDLRTRLQQELHDNEEIRSKVRAIHELVMGNHRLIVHFYGFLKADIKSDLSVVFAKQMNDLKSYYEQYVKGLSVQQQRIVQLLSLHHHPITGKAIAQRTFLTANVVSKQLSVLFKLGFVDKEKKGKEAYYELREPLMRMCFEINESPDGITRLFVDFLKNAYDDVERKRRFLFHKYGSKFRSDDDVPRYLSEASLYEQTLSIEDLAGLKGAEDALVRCAEDQLQERIDELLQEPNEFFRRCQVLYENGEFDQLYEVANAWADQDMMNASAYFFLGAAKVALDQVEEAIMHFRKAVKLEPDNVHVRFVLAKSLQYQGDSEEAIMNLTKIIELKPNSAPFNRALGATLLESGQVEEAITYFERVIQLEPDNALAYSGLGHALSKLGKVEKAILNLERAIQLNPDNALTHTRLGEMLMISGRTVEAATHFERAIEFGRDNADVRFRLGGTLLGLNRIEDAIGHLDKAIELEPDDVVYRLGVGLILRILGRVEEAEVHLYKAVELEPDGWRPYSILGRMWLELGDWDRAKNNVERAIELSTGSDLDSLSSMVKLHIRFQDWDVATKYLDAIFEEKLSYHQVMLSHDVQLPICRYVPDHLLDEWLSKTQAYLDKQNALDMYFGAFSNTVFTLLIDEASFTKEKLEHIFKTLSVKYGDLDGMKVPLLLLRVGIDYYKYDDDHALLRLSKEERAAFHDFVIQPKSIKARLKRPK